MTTDQLWEDNWDDDDVEDDFSKQLRYFDAGHRRNDKISYCNILREELKKMSTTNASNPPNDTVMAS